MATNNKSKKLCCSFCGRSETEVELLIPAERGNLRRLRDDLRKLY